MAVTVALAQNVACRQNHNWLIVVMITLFMIFAAPDIFGQDVVVATSGRALVDARLQAEPMMPMASQRHVDHDGNACEFYQ